MGHSLSLLTAALLVGQTPVMIDSNGKQCACKNGQQQANRVIVAQPEGNGETRTVGWFNRNSGTTTTEWRSTTAQEPSWVDNRPVLSRIKGWFSKSDSSSNGTSGTVIRSEPARTTNGQPVIVQPSTGTTPEYYRRLPTTNEPPLAGTPAITTTPAKSAAPIAPPKAVAPATPKAAPATPNGPLTIELEPIEFRPAGSAKGAFVTPAATTTAVAPSASLGATSNRPNPISERFMNKVGQPGDYSWITGQLEIRNGQHLLHYASPDTIDRFEGTVILSADGRMLTNVRSGDLVSVHGAITHQSGRNGVYRVQTIDLIER